MPISLPSKPGIRQISWPTETKVAATESIFTFKPHVYAWSGKRKKALIEVPRMSIANAKRWRGVFLKINGPENEFYVENVLTFAPSGNIVIEDTTISSISSDRATITTAVTAEVNKINVLSPGDVISVNDNLYEVTGEGDDTIDSESTGVITFSVWPTLRADVTTGNTIKFRNQRGTFRMVSIPEYAFDVDRLAEGFTFEAFESI
jgi:hypothetical protein